MLSRIAPMGVKGSEEANFPHGPRDPDAPHASTFHGLRRKPKRNESTVPLVTVPGVDTRLTLGTSAIKRTF